MPDAGRLRTFREERINMSLTLQALVLAGGIASLANAAVGGSTAAHAFFYPRPKVPAVLEVRQGEGKNAPSKTMAIEGIT